MAQSGKTTKTFGSSSYSVVFAWEVISQNVQDNSTTIEFSLTLNDLKGYGGTFTSDGTISVNVNGESFSDTVASGTVLSPNGSLVLLSTTTTIPHNSFDAQVFSYQYSCNWTLSLTATDGMSFQQTGNGEGVLDAIVRMATIKSVSPDNPTDEDNFTITYSNPSGTYATELQACISFSGGNDDIPYRDISKTGTSYTFTLTEAEKATLYSKLNEGYTTLSVRFYVRSRVPTGSASNYETYWDYITKTITFVDYYPVLNPTVIDNNSDTLRLTGDSSVLVRYMSEAYFTTGAEAIKGATITNQYISNGDLQVDNTSEGTISGVTSNTFYFGVTDSRGHSERDFVVFNGSKWIEYIKPTCKARTDNITAEGELTFHLSGKYFEGNFGIAPNTLSADYQIYKDGEEGTWTSYTLSPVVDTEGNYTATFTISGLDYSSRYNFVIRVFDELNTSSQTLGIVTTEPLFDWGKDDFKFYIPVELTKGFTYPQWLLWQLPESPSEEDINKALLAEGQTITLDYPISSMPTGVVLVFSLYRDGKVEDASIHSFFKSKTEIKYLLPDAKHTFMMGINSNLSVFGSKYVIMSDSELRGFSGNTSTGTAACGITFDNTKFILRYVIGV